MKSGEEQHQKNTGIRTIPSGLKARLSFTTFVVALVLLILLGMLACKNISYPLLWNDESETAMTAQQITKHGYPKVHDEKNVVFTADNPAWLGYKPSCDANISIPWGNYYFGTIGVLLTRLTNDIYQKTALVRLPFVITGLFGLLIFAFTMRRFFSTSFSFRLFFAAFLVFEMLSVNLLLHIREARYYSLVILITGCYFYVFTAFRFHGNYSRRKYILLLTTILVAAFNINFTVYVSICATTGLYQCFAYFNYRWGRRRFLFSANLKESLLLISPLILSFFILLPELVFFEILRTAELADLYYRNSPGGFVRHLKDIITIMCRFDLLPAMLIIKILRAGYGYAINKNNVSRNDRARKLEAMSFFMGLFFIVFVLATARMPFVFTRYFIVLQPIVILILLTDVFILLDYAVLLSPIKPGAIRLSILSVTCCLCVINVVLSDNHILDYLYQISHPYRGPLDFYLPAIKARFPHPENIVLATNYEEMSYEYYLDCKVILGYQNHFQSTGDTVLQRYSPDVIIIRPGWGKDNKPFEYYLHHASYQKISFPVQDWQVNNMADLYFFVKHQFKTRITDIENEKACMYIKIRQVPDIDVP